MSHYFIECTIEKNRVPYAEIQLDPWTFQCVSVGVLWWCPHGSWCSDQQTFQHTWPLVIMQACFCHRIKKVKTVIVTVLSHNSDLYWNCEFASCNSDFIRIVRYCKFTIAREKSEFWDKVTITHCPLYSMAEISFHKFHMCMGKKQTNIKNAQSNTHSHSSPLPLLPFSDPTIPLPLPGIILFSFWFFVLFCIHKTNSKRSFLLYVVDVMERVSTPDYSSNSAISKYFSDLLLKSAYQLLQYFI